MKISFQEIAKRITGISTPIFGISWEPPNSEVSVVRRLLTFLEDRRVLFYPAGAEDPDHVTQSIIEIRKRLTQELEELDRSSELAQSLSVLRRACRRYLDKTTIGITIPSGNLTMQPILGGALMYFHALGDLRAVFGIHLAQLAVKYGIDVEEELVSIFPSDNVEQGEKATEA